MMLLKPVSSNIVIDNINVERVQSFQYLGAMFTTNGDGASNINQRLAIALQALNNNNNNNNKSLFQTRSPSTT